MWVLVVIGVIIGLVVWYFFSTMFYELAVMKGFPEKKYLWLTFFFGLVGAVLVAALPDRGNVKANISKDNSMPSKQEDVFASAKIEKPNISSQSGWRCPDCGRINQEFMENCFDCGAKKP